MIEIEITYTNMSINDVITSLAEYTRDDFHILSCIIKSEQSVEKYVVELVKY